ncbi:MAG: serine/threonine-protein kinase [Nevskiales bacterium]|nr:serine/threonine-protein kinase [Nevskiales bacterium]
MPKVIGKYRLHGELGRGSSGVVYKGFDPFVQRDIAIKIAQQVPALAIEGPAEQVHAAFFKEARAAGRLLHPHIVALYDAGTESSFNYIVMEYIDGDTLLPLCHKSGPRAPVERVVEIVFACAKALDYAHGKGVLHRDIKPSNIMLNREGVPKVMDFSIAEIHAQTDGVREVVGSPMYMSPEQVRAEPLGPASDLYALGAVMFHLLVGEPPFTLTEVPALFRAITDTPAPRLSTRRSDLPPPAVEIVERLLLKNPAERYSSGQELATDLMRLSDKLRQTDTHLARRERRDAMRRLHFFDGFADGEIDEIIGAGALLTFQAGQTLVQEGEMDRAFYILAQGSAEVRKAGKVLRVLEKGDCFGEMAFLTASRRTATVVAASPVLVLKASATLMDRLSQDTQLRFYKVFTETLIYRLTVAGTPLSAHA